MESEKQSYHSRPYPPPSSPPLSPQPTMPNQWLGRHAKPQRNVVIPRVVIGQTAGEMAVGYVGVGGLVKGGWLGSLAGVQSSFNASGCKRRGSAGPSGEVTGSRSRSRAEGGSTLNPADVGAPRALWGRFRVSRLRRIRMAKIGYDFWSSMTLCPLVQLEIILFFSFPPLPPLPPLSISI